MNRGTTNENSLSNYGLKKWEVKNVRDTKAGIFFSLYINGVIINNCKVVESQTGDFIGLPKYKGSDGKWYSYVYFKFTDEEQTDILSAIEKVLNDD